ncbi:hypothetical protein [Spirillospora albida]|uniref:hypothetical protein n=1 Tax=Spirillospora albida TaxID=58123 RepID=UPI0004C218BE|nr:hypothetical protein [Spirillospora albida]
MRRSAALATFVAGLALPLGLTATPAQASAVTSFTVTFTSLSGAPIDMTRAIIRCDGSLRTCERGSGHLAFVTTSRNVKTIDLREGRALLVEFTADAGFRMQVARGGRVILDRTAWKEAEVEMWTRGFTFRKGKLKVL